VGGKRIKVFATKGSRAARLELGGRQIVIESTGRFTDAKEAAKHFAAA
jgi:glyceraldehyde 3-phosphate dehydrogenase